MNRYLLPLIAATLLASGCANTPAPQASAPATSDASAANAAAAAEKAAQAAKAEQAKAAIAAAEKSEAQAAASGFEWRDTGDLIAEAKKAAAANDFDKAIKLAGQAERQGALAVKQAAIETERVSKMK